MVERLEATIATVKRMELYRGHLFNWYDTTDLRPLEPKYVSSVDSGNLAGHLIAVANACAEASTEPGGDWTAGARDSLALVQDALATVARGQGGVQTQIQKVKDQLAAFSDLLGRSGATLGEATTQSASLVGAARALKAQCNDDYAAEILIWSEAAQHAVASHVADLTLPSTLTARLRKLEDTAHDLFNAMDFRFLLNGELKLLSIGYLVGTETLDPKPGDEVPGPIA